MLIPMTRPPGVAGATHTRTPLKMLKAVPAGFPLPLHDDYFGVAGHSDAIFSNIQSGGEDLRAFTDEAMTTELPLEIISIIPGSNLLLGYVRVSSALAINDYIYLRTTIAGGETAPAADSTYGSEAVWSDYSFVLHGNAITVDASGNESDGTNTGGVAKSGGDLLNTWPATGYGAREGTNSTDKLTMTTPPNVDVCAESVVFFKDNTEDDAGGTIVQWAGNITQLQKRTTDNFIWRRAASTTAQSVEATSGELTGDAWHHGGALFPAIGSAPSVRLDGAALTSPTIVNGTGTRSSVTDLLLNNIVSGALPGDIRVAEYRYRPDNTPDSAWFDLEWDGFNDPASVAEAEALVVV